ncbi:MAG: hypothetical protein ABIP88_11345 [Candidatus Binatia bacterium]
MPNRNRFKSLALVAMAALSLYGASASTQDEVQPTNDLANPYQSTAP